MLHIIRGLPGSGKTTFANTLGCFHIEADMFFVQNGVYTFNDAHIAQAHTWCFNTAVVAVKEGIDVAVSNTFNTMWAFEKYLKIDTDIKVYRCAGRWKSVHNIPADRLEMMEQRFEYYKDEILINGPDRLRCPEIKDPLANHHCDGIKDAFPVPTLCEVIHCPDNIGTGNCKRGLDPKTCTL